MRVRCAAVLLCLVSLVALSSCASTYTSRGVVPAEESFQNLTQITFDEKPDIEPHLSADGRLLVFASRRDGDYNIYMKNPGSKAVIRKTSHGANDVNPVFSPDAARFAFASSRSGNFDIYIMNTQKGKAKIQVTESPENELFPSWSPDGTKLAFTRLPAMGEPYIWMKDLESGEMTQICVGLAPKFSPDGTRLLYKKAGYRKLGGSGFYELWAVDLDGDNDTQIVASDQWGIRSFCWSPDGRHVMFSTSKKARSTSAKIAYGRTLKKGADLWTVRVDGSVVTQVTSHRGTNGDPFWAAGGHVYFVSDRSGGMNIWRFQLQD